MLGILAHTYLTATRIHGVRLRPLPPRKRRWLPIGHWWIDRSRAVNPHDL
ncbi:hypothetical protein ACFO5X_09565 [Seohaeicola nanhaiensis]|uniref:Uncharacterized protein n=1 Tax=Seohaeicola nanhaiensis TaxID=1387282 RepID=A0ABV9KF29_9RHOB